MASNTVPAATAAAPRRVRLALQALNQIDALVSIAQQLAYKGGDDALLGLLGRFQQLNASATLLLVDNDSDIAAQELHILGAQGVNHG